jgi:type IV secretion system protein VirB1
MILTVATLTALALRCAPAAAPETLLAVAEVESGRNPFAIGVNRGAGAPPPAATRDAAIAAARRLLARGANVDLGLAQINSANLGPLGLTVDDAFDPCRNLAAAARLLSADYQVARYTFADEQAALRRALSRYNTGDDTRGFRNGYVARVEAAAAGRATPAARDAPSAPAWDAFSHAPASAFVLSPTLSEGASH